MDQQNPIEMNKGKPPPQKKVYDGFKMWMFNGFTDFMYLRNFDCGYCNYFLEDPKQQRWILDYDRKITPHHDCL